MNEAYRVAYHDNTEQRPRCEECQSTLTPDAIEEYNTLCEPCYNEIKYLQS